jgi:hypothetical protein
MLYSAVSGDELLGDAWIVVAGLVIDLVKVGIANYDRVIALQKQYASAQSEAEKQIIYNQLLQIATEAGALKSASSSEKTKKILVYSGVALVAVLLSFFLTTR